MKICVLVHLFPARSETFVRQHVAGLAKRGHDVTVIAREPGDGITAAEFASLESDGVRCVYVGNLQNKLDLLGAGLSSLLHAPRYTMHQFLSPGAWKRRYLLLANRYADQVARINPDVVHIHFGNLAARVHQVTQAYSAFPPTIVTWHGYEANILPQSLGFDLYLDLFERGWTHTVGSHFMRKRLQGLGAEKVKVDVVPMGVDLNVFRYRDRPSQPRSPLRVLSVGRLDEVKGHEYLIEAISVLGKSGFQVQLRLIGDGPLRQMLERRIHRAGITHCAQLVGSMDSHSIVDEMHNAHIFALTGVITKKGAVESQGVVLAEAQATGLPVIASDVGGVSESVIDGQTAILCAPTDVAAVVQAVRFFANDRNAIARYGARGRGFVEEKFSLHLMLDRFEALYQRRSE